MDIQPLTTALGNAPQALSVARETPALPQVFKSAPQPESVQPAPTKEQVKEAVEEIQESIGKMATNLRFSVDEATGRTIVSVVDAETMEVVRQIPAEEVMKMARAIDRMQGLLFRGKA